MSERLTEALKEVNATRQRIAGESYYLVQGKTRSYVLRIHDNKTFEFPSMRMVGIFDQTGTAEVGEEELISRLYTLKNDNKIASVVPTLQ